MHLTMLLEMAADGVRRPRSRSAPRHRRADLRRAARPGAGAPATWAADARRRAGRPRRRQLRRRADAAVRQRLSPGVPFVPINYRLADDKLRAILARTAPSVVVVDDAGAGAGRRRSTASSWSPRAELPRPSCDARRAGRRRPPTPTPTTSPSCCSPAARRASRRRRVLRHRHLASYVIGTVEFMGADEDEAALVSVPPYHVAGISAVRHRRLRRPAHRATCRPSRPRRGSPWLATRRSPRRWSCRPCSGAILDVHRARRTSTLPHLRHLSYGGGRMPVAGDRAGAGAAAPRRLRQRLRPDRDQLDDRRARPRRPPRWRSASDDPAVRAPARLGRPAAADARGRDPRRRRRARSAPASAARSTCAASRSPASTSGAPTCWTTAGSRPRDAGSLDEDGFLYLEGRLDDVIVRGGENLSPGEIEDVLVAHPRSPTPPSSACPTPSGARRSSPPWSPSRASGRREAELQAWVKDRLRSSKVPTARVRVRRRCRTTRPASCCAACCASSSPSSSALRGMR